MKKFTRISVAVVAIIIIIIAGFNVLALHRMKDMDSYLYRVECARVIRELNDHKSIDLSQYKTIIDVHEYDSDRIVNHDYKITFVDDRCYQVEYRQNSDYRQLIFMNMGFVLMLLLVCGILIYVNVKILKPFETMSHVSVELAKGNLGAEVKEDKNKFFGRFVWGINMLRDNLENNREKELALQKEKKSLILSISHDIKTPLSAIKLYTKALSENLYDSEERKAEILQGISENTKQIEKYVAEIVAASREDFLNLEAMPGEYYLSDVMKKIEAYYSDKLSFKHTAFSVDQYDNCLLKCDLDRLIEVLENVMENAIKYGDGKYICINFAEEEDCKLITVKNSGSTIKDEELPHLFESFYRGSNADGIKGSGLGLYIAKTLMRLQDGDIFARNIDGDFEITLVVRMI